MWTTQDGYTLRLSRSGLATITSRLRQSGLQDLAKKNYRGDLRQAVARSIAQLAGNAYRIGTLRHVASSKRYPVFTAYTNARNYQIVTRPLASGQKVIVFVRPQPAGETAEYMTTRPPGFGPPIRLAQAPSVVSGRGLYRIYRDRSLVYVGETQDFSRRLQQHLWCLTHLRIDHAPYTVRVASMPRSTDVTRRTAERRIIIAHPRALAHQREMEELWSGSY